LQGDHSIRALNGMWFCHTRPQNVDLFYLPYGLRQDRIARWLTGTVSAQRAATAAQKIATRGEIGGSGWSIGRLNLDANEKTLIAVRSPLRRWHHCEKSGWICAGQWNQRYPASCHNDGKADCSVAVIGVTRIRDWARLGSARWCSADSRRISVRAFPRGEGLHPRRRQPRSRATPITIAPVRHSRRTAFAVRPRLTTT